MDTINLQEKLQQIQEYWHPHIVGELNGQYVKLAKINGTFDWHHHEKEDELFMVIQGHLHMDYREKTVAAGPGEIIIVPKGVEHRPRTESETHILLFEPKTTLNTGEKTTERTRTDLPRL